MGSGGRATTTTRPRRYRDNQGRTQTRQVQHVRWEPASGVVEHFFDDEPVPGTQGVSHALLRQIEPFATNELVPYDTAFLSGFIVEHYQVVLLEAAQASQDAMTEQAATRCAPREIPGDTYRNLEIHPTFSAQTFKHILVPVWLLSYLYGTTDVTRWSSTATTDGWRGSIRRAPGRSRCSCCSRSSRF